MRTQTNLPQLGLISIAAAPLTNPSKLTAVCKTIVLQLSKAV
ncbi:hypothetical protein [Nostoc commune]|nr:hypothetical protein [Nostoc commune]